ncbi:hypothetical protein ON064_09340 [Planococcus sp. A6]|uniref:hypothetical protein n=1 Tax=Planococcus sp. A6 TaxID=2992760 RepID=UPI00237BD57F|nr:hypothetical protein [Planococcus sp. A6]MDE0583239.1 hypothetical protein [Planococcus sp. A6]
MMQQLNPLFQLNMLIHLSLPYPKNSNIYPYFNRQGYSIKQIEKTIPLDPINVKKLKTVCEPQKNVTPEIVLYNESKNEYILIECKVQSFEVDWSQRGTKQAAGYLSLTPEYLKEIFILEKNEKINSKIIYGVNHTQAQELFDSVKIISDEVKGVLGHSLEHETLGMEISNTGLYLSTFKNKTTKKVRILDGETIKQQALIYIIPFDINGKMEDDNRELLKTQVRNSLRSLLGKNIGAKSFSFSSLTICEKINPVWNQLPPAFQKKLKRWVHTYAKEIFAQIHSLGVEIVLNGQTYSVPSINDKKIKTIRKFLTSEKFLETGQNIFTNADQMTIEDFLDSE